ncbi:type I-E CRISPR-associated protein Cas6/Cse3/CasE [Herpetosiphon gulosus]|uniref:CRISPR-associated endoribonuclease Cse3 n=1 Tax=Herpetosiphon gulosus TaxID=1973496 RepID=A0ABP9X6Z4_9CHLR
MVYLSRIILNATERDVQTRLSNCHALHTLALRGFPQLPAGTDHARAFFGVLFRLESVLADQQQVRLLVQSTTLPDWSRIPSGWLGSAPDERGNPAVRTIDQEYGNLDQVTDYFFRLRANPTKRISARNLDESERWQKKQVDLRTDHDRMEWLMRQANNHGFRIQPTPNQPTIPAVQILPQPTSHGRDQEHRLTFGAATFEGILRITDLARFRQALEHGIGKGKAYGFGLLSIATLGSRS